MNLFGKCLTIAMLAASINAVAPTQATAYDLGYGGNRGLGSYNNFNRVGTSILTQPGVIGGSSTGCGTSIISQPAVLDSCGTTVLTQPAMLDNCNPCNSMNVLTQPAVIAAPPMCNSCPAVIPAPRRRGLLGSLFGFLF